MLEDLKRSSDLLNNVKIGKGQQQLIMKHILFNIYGGCHHFSQVTVNDLMNTLSNRPVNSGKESLTFPTSIINSS